MVEDIQRLFILLMSISFVVTCNSCEGHSTADQQYIGTVIILIKAGLMHKNNEIIKWCFNN